MCFYQLEPFGAEANYLGHAITASTVANMLRDPKRSQSFKPEDFMPKFEEIQARSEQKSAEELWMNFKTWAMMAGVEGEPESSGKAPRIDRSSVQEEHLDETRARQEFQ